MNRKIKFRGYSSKDDRFHYGFAFNPYLDIWYILHSDDDLPFNEIERECLVSKSSIGQFTGLNDKKGIEIYENDILELPNGTQGVVEWLECGFVLKLKNETIWQSLLFNVVNHYTVVGNIHERK